VNGEFLGGVAASCWAEWLPRTGQGGCLALGRVAAQREAAALPDIGEAAAVYATVSTLSKTVVRGSFSG
jgi:hypothetical protein